MSAWDVKAIVSKQGSGLLCFFMRHSCCRLATMIHHLLFSYLHLKTYSVTAVASFIMLAKKKHKRCFFFFFVCIEGLQTDYVHCATYCIRLCAYANMLGHRTTLLMWKWASEGKGRGVIVPNVKTPLNSPVAIKEKHERAFSCKTFTNVFFKQSLYSQTALWRNKHSQNFLTLLS